MTKNSYAYPVSNCRFYSITALIVVLFIFGLHYYLVSDNGFKFTLSVFLLFIVVWWGEHYVKMFKDFFDTPYLTVKEIGIYCHRLFDEQNIEIQWQNVLYAFFECRGKKLILHLFVNDNNIAKHIQLTANGLYFNDEKCDYKFANELLQELHNLIEQKRPKVTPVKQNQAVLDSPQIWTMPHSVSAVILWLGGFTILILFLIVVMMSIETKSYLFLLLSSPFFVIGFVKFVLYFWKKARFHNHFYLDNVGVHFYHYELHNRQPVTLLWEQIYDVDYFGATNGNLVTYYLTLSVNPVKDTTLIIDMYFAIGNRFNKDFTKSLYDSIGKIILQKNGNIKCSDFISCSKLFSVYSGEYSFLCNDIEI
ncbi:Uncharacterised protein [Moraxella caprae]|uniref:Transmembrane protein n=2 Tax=Moraxella caprae TaxID=90240 RepID=A0A378QZP8_9GAMM|nr:hypothetical protein [Moraxella caprae]STZ08523.1 Uncharacterised protein [Moraxella caprae]